MLELIRPYDETSKPPDREGARYRRAEVGGRVSALKRDTMCPFKRRSRSSAAAHRTEDEHDGKSTDQIENGRVSP